MSIWGDASSLLSLGLFIFFFQNICLISGESSRSGLDWKPNNNRTRDKVNMASRIVRDSGKGSKINLTGSQVNPDPTKLPKTTTTPLPGCEKGSLEKCQKMQPVPFGIGLPSTPAAVEKACKAFDLGMDCFYAWGRLCMKEDQMQMFNTSILGAHEIFAFLCRDPGFRQDYLQHNKCYQKISKRWDECAAKFIDVLQSPEINIKNESDTQICCLRYGFIQCVMQITYSKCNADDPKAARFVQQMAETVLRAGRKGHSPQQCDRIKHELQEHCPTESIASHLVFPFEILISVNTLLLSSFV